MKLIALPLILVASLGFAAKTMAAPAMHQVYQHHYKKMHSGAHLGPRQACIGRSSGTAYKSCGSHTGGPAGGLH